MAVIMVLTKQYFKILFLIAGNQLLIKIVYSYGFYFLETSLFTLVFIVFVI